MHLIIPYASSQSEGCAAARAALHLPHLQQLLTRLTVADVDSGDVMSFSPPHERALAKALRLPGGDGRIAWAALQARQQAQLAPLGNAWGFITLCHWQVNTNHMVMSHLPLPGLSAAQSDDLLAAMQPYFAEDGISLHADLAGRFLAQAPVFADIDSASLDRVVGHNLEHWMPSSAQCGALLRLQNEMQMLFYNHPVNDARAAQGLPPVNSFWLSGTGALEGDYAAPAAEEEPVVANELRAPALAENWTDWATAWAELDTTVINAMGEHARQGQAVRLTLCGECAYQSWRTERLSSWQKIKRRFGTKPFPELLGQL